MKLSCVLLLALVAVAVADSYEPYQNDYNQAESNDYYSQDSNNFYSRRGRPASSGGVFGSVRRAKQNVAAIIQRDR